MRVKICGVTTPADARLAADAGADAVGLNFYPPSPRYVDPARAIDLVRELPPLVDAVGVFVEESLRSACDTARRLGLRAVQWVGDRPEVADPAPVELIPAFRIGAAGDLDGVTAYLARCAQAGFRPAAVLLDARVEGAFGGTGRVAPWELIAAFRPGVPVILAGGLTPENVAAAVRVVRPYAVDVASGVESAPGVKDPEKVRRFIDAAKRAGE